MNDIEILINDVLSEKRMKTLAPNSCLVMNQAAQELEEAGNRALPEIEHAIQKKVVPDSLELSAHNDILRKFPGLINLWMAYYEICGSSQIGRVIEFLKTVNGSVFTIALLAMNPFWQPSRGRMPDVLRALLIEVAGQKNGADAAEAVRVLENATK